MRLSKAELLEQAEHIPVSSILGKGVTQQLTPKQKKFAREIVKGKTKADAYRAAYDVTSRHTMASKPYELMRDERIKAEIAALEAAERAQAYRTPSRLRALVVETLAQVATNPEEKTSDRLRAAQLIGQITEVAAFTERKEVRTISSSEAARAAVLDEIKALMAQAEEVTDVEAKSLLEELSAPMPDADSGNVTKQNDNDPAEPPDTP
jgi:phage terminase small subunit